MYRAMPRACFVPGVRGHSACVAKPRVDAPPVHGCCMKWLVSRSTVSPYAPSPGGAPVGHMRGQGRSGATRPWTASANEVIHLGHRGAVMVADGYGYVE